MRTRPGSHAQLDGSGFAFLDPSLHALHKARNLSIRMMVAGPPPHLWPDRRLDYRVGGAPQRTAPAPEALGLRQLQHSPTRVGLTDGGAHDMSPGTVSCRASRSWWRAPPAAPSGHRWGRHGWRRPSSWFGRTSAGTASSCRTHRTTAPRTARTWWRSAPGGCSRHNSRRAPGRPGPSAGGAPCWPTAVVPAGSCACAPCCACASEEYKARMVNLTLKRLSKTAPVTNLMMGGWKANLAIIVPAEDLQEPARRLDRHVCHWHSGAGPTPPARTNATGQKPMAKPTSKPASPTTSHPASAPSGWSTPYMMQDASAA